MDRWQYLIVLCGCLAITLPLEIFRPGVYRQAWRAARAVLPVAAVFVLWDEVAIAAIEEVLFFLVIPLCALLTYNAVSAILRLRKHR